MKKFFLFAFVFLTFCVAEVSAAHYLVGRVNNSLDGVLADGHTVVVWNPDYGISENVTDTVGPSGNSGSNNYYMVDCESLAHPCAVGDTLYSKVLNTGDYHNSENVSVDVTGAGYDVLPPILLNSPINVSSVLVDDSILSPLNQIDLVTASTRKVTCTSVMEDPEGGPVLNASARLFSLGSSYDSLDDNSTHYTNSSCFVNSSYSGNTSLVNCTFEVFYYANPGNWTCLTSAQDNLSMGGNSTDDTFINPLLSVGVQSEIDFGSVGVGSISDEKIVNVTNYGNVAINLSLYGYGQTPGDNLAMNCTIGNISIGDERYNLTSPNPGQITISQFDSNYQNLTSVYTVRNFGLNKKNNSFNATKPTYWRMRLHPGITGNCSGSVVFGASSQGGV